MTKIADIRGKSTDELKDMVVILKKELFNLRFRASAGDSPNTARFGEVRRDIARAKTLLNDPLAGSAVVKTKAAKAAKAPKAAKAVKEPKETKAKKPAAKKKASGE